MAEAQKVKLRSKCFQELLTAAHDLMYDSALIGDMPIEFRRDPKRALCCSGCGAELDDGGEPSRHHGGCKVGRLQDAVHAYIGYGDDDDA